MRRRLAQAALLPALAVPMALSAPGAALAATPGPAGPGVAGTSSATKSSATKSKVTKSKVTKSKATKSKATAGRRQAARAAAAKAQAVQQRRAVAARMARMAAQQRLAAGTRLRARVSELQYRLSWAGTYTGPKNGILTASVASALRRYQVKFNLPRYSPQEPAALASLRAVTRKGDAIDARCRVARKVMCVDKTLRVARAMQGGKVLFQADARFGRPGMRTREGVFQVYWKSRYHRANGSRSWSAYMPYALFFSGGQAVHWSPTFLRDGYSGASHGCVNIRDLRTAVRMFDWAPPGTKVVVYRSRR